MLLTRDAVQSLNDAIVEQVALPEWATPENPEPFVYVRRMPARDRDAFEVSNVKVERNGRRGDRVSVPQLQNYRARLAVLTCCDEKGERIFTDEDAGWLGQKSSVALNRIVEVAHRLNGIGEEAAEEAKKN